MTIALTDFARRVLFPRDPCKTAIQDCTPVEFEQRLNTGRPLQWLDGYAPFCRLLVFANWTTTRCSTIPITAQNNHLLRSAYETRSSDELPVLRRWFEGVEAPVARYLLPILYDQAQLQREGVMISAQWGVVGCLYTNEPKEIPMAPITMMRNALGVDEGGSGVPLDRHAYQCSVVFWQTHANWR